MNYNDYHNFHAADYALRMYGRRYDALSFLQQLDVDNAIARRWERLELFSEIRNASRD